MEYIIAGNRKIHPPNGDRKVSVQSRQALRLMKFVAEMRKNTFPNAGSFAKLLQQADVDENIPCSCSARTIMRDIETLKNDYGAPIEYDPSNRGYFLLNPGWELTVPILSDDVLSMSILGAKLASDILPEPVRGNVNSAMEKALVGNNSTFFDDAMVESILCATGIKAAVDPAIFKKIFDAWRQHQVMEITYRRPDGEESVRRFEPHIIAFHRGIWYVKGYKYGTKEIRLYAIQRITSLHGGIDCFETDKKLLEDTRKIGLFNYEKVSGIKLHCDASIAFYIYEQQKKFHSKIERQADDSLIITLNPSIEHEVIRWILAEAGRIQVLEPASLRRKIREAGKSIYTRNS